jgi:flavin reductase (DIM6/NTAB) family NADH-FMN oxidoreductase RutF
MSISPSDFRQTLARFPSGVTVVTAKGPEGAPIGLTVSAFTSLSLAPPLILVCLDNATAHLSAYTSGKGFCVNILAGNQAEISNGFAFPGPNNPFEMTPHRDTMHGAKALTEAAANLECGVHAVHPGGDHQILVGLVEHVTWRDDVKPLVYHSGDYRGIGDLG